MSDKVKRILFVNSEIFPYLPESPVSNIGRYLPQGLQEKGLEVRSFMPRYGCINERKNQLHEVIRLSGMNIILNDLDRPLIIKVASISSARMQVYFIDNDDYFKRKETFRDAAGVFFADNAERAVFFARSVMETVKKLRWQPDIIHCQGWFTHVLPLYLKKIYRGDPIFSSCRVMLSLYDDTPAEPFSDNFRKLILFNDLTEKDTDILKSPTGVSLAKLAIRHADGLIFGSERVDPEIAACCEASGLPMLPYRAASYEDDSYIDDYNRFYDQF